MFVQKLLFNKAIEKLRTFSTPKSVHVVEMSAEVNAGMR